MAIAGYAEHDNRHSIACVKVKPVSLSGKYVDVDIFGNGKTTDLLIFK